MSHLCSALLSHSSAISVLKWQKPCCGCRSLMLQRQRYASSAVAASRRCARQVAVRATELEAVDLEVPEMDDDLKACQRTAGCTGFSEDGAPLSFGNDEDAIFTSTRGAVVTDRSHWGRFRIGGNDRASFLHGQSTADILALSPGQGCDTVFITAQGRCVDLATCIVQPSGILVITSPGMAQPIMERLNKLILYGDDVELRDIESRTAMLTLAGPGAPEVLAALGAEQAADLQSGQHMMLQAGSSPTVVTATRTLGERDFTLIADEAVAGKLWKSLVAKGAVAMGETAWQQTRLQAGRPQVGAELTQDVTPLEAGLYHACSLAKGCYIGQERLAQVHMKGIAKTLVGVRLSALASSGDDITEGDERLGQITSIQAQPDGQAFALGYVRCRRKGQQMPVTGRKVQVGSATGELVEVPFLSREFEPQHAPPLGVQSRAAAPDASETDVDKAKAAAEAAKAERLRKLEERLAAWQAQQ